MDIKELYGAEKMPPALHGQKCKGCGRLSFPPNPYGCERCGASASELVDYDLRGQGRLQAFATAYHSLRKDIEVPFTVASIRLEDGPVIRALMNEPTDDGLSVGDTVIAVHTAGRQLRFQRQE